MKIENEKLEIHVDFCAPLFNFFAVLFLCVLFEDLNEENSPETSQLKL